MLWSAVDACICVLFMMAAVQLQTRSLVYLRSFSRGVFLFRCYGLMRFDKGATRFMSSPDLAAFSH